jgi:phage tail sheath protein FI
MGTMKTPGVYIVEKNAFPNSIVEVETAVPAFIGYTEKADNKGKSLLNKPWRISSMVEFLEYYGGAPTPSFTIKEVSNGVEPDIVFRSADENKPTEIVLERLGPEYIFYYCIRLFFQNGGGPCYIVSIGSYDNEAFDPDKMKTGIKTLIKETEPTMVVIPEAVKLTKEADCIGVQQASLMHCGDKMKNRVSVLDVYDGYKELQDPDEPIKKFRNALGINNLDFAAAYYPWLNTTIIQDKDIGYFHLDDNGLKELERILKSELVIPLKEELGLPAGEKDGAQKGQKSPKSKPAPTGESPDQVDEEQVAALTQMKKDNEDFISELIKKAGDKDKRDTNDKALVRKSQRWALILKEITRKFNLLPPAAAMAGIYTMVDNSRGVWKAPANVSLNSVVSPAVNISHDDQEDLNVTIHGKSINAIRTFIGEGVLVWGARTLDGNSLDWRYINVRRTMIMLEESIKNAAKAYVFEPNDANTWITMKSMIKNFLNGIWKRGGLAGSTPEDAFSVHVGLGETMTPEDILEGILRITVLVAVTRPAEFIEITFQQQMQKS